MDLIKTNMDTFAEYDLSDFLQEQSQREVLYEAANRLCEDVKKYVLADFLLKPMPVDYNHQESFHKAAKRQARQNRCLNLESQRLEFATKASIEDGKRLHAANIRELRMTDREAKKRKLRELAVEAKAPKPSKYARIRVKRMEEISPGMFRSVVTKFKWVNLPEIGWKRVVEPLDYDFLDKNTGGLVQIADAVYYDLDSKDEWHFAQDGTWTKLIVVPDLDDTFDINSILE